MKANDSDDESQIKVAKLNENSLVNSNHINSNNKQVVNSQLNSSKKIKLEKMDDENMTNETTTTTTNYQMEVDMTIKQNIIKQQHAPSRSTKRSMSKFALKSLRRTHQRTRLKNKLQAYMRLEKQQQKLDKQKELRRNLENKSYEFLFQSVLFDYLEYKAPYLNNYSYETRLRFANIISLYYMLINCRLFSHDQLVCTLISRGESFQNNLNDIKRPSRLLINRGDKLLVDSSNQTNLQQKQQLQQQQQRTASGQSSSLSMKPQYSSQMSSQSNLNKRNSIDYPSPMSVYNQPPASMPPYNFPPHTPLQHQKSTSSITNNANTSMSSAQVGVVNDPYAAPLSVPTPSRSSSMVNKPSNSQQFQQQLSGYLISF
jgi:hypothetical protein